MKEKKRKGKERKGKENAGNTSFTVNGILSNSQYIDSCHAFMTNPELSVFFLKEEKKRGGGGGGIREVVKLNEKVVVFIYKELNQL